MMSIRGSAAAAAFEPGSAGSEICLSAGFRTRRSYDLDEVRLRVDIHVEIAPSLAQADAAVEVLSQDLLRWLEVWLARRLSYLPDAGDIERQGDGGQLELHLHGKLLAVLNVTVERVVG